VGVLEGRVWRSALAANAPGCKQGVKRPGEELTTTVGAKDLHWSSGIVDHVVKVLT
jgi:hypothetical protein